MKNSKYEIDMCNGSIMDKLISFSLPLMLSGILQLMFNAVDIIVVGGGWFNHRPDQCFHQSFYRYFAWGKCTGGKVLCDGQIKRNVGNSTYFDHAGDGQRCDHGICRCSVCERCTGIDGNAG